MRRVRDGDNDSSPDDDNNDDSSPDDDDNDDNDDDYWPLVGLLAVWGTSPSDVYAVGCSGPLDCSNGAIAHYDGVTWSTIPGEESANEQ